MWLSPDEFLHRLQSRDPSRNDTVIRLTFGIDGNAEVVCNEKKLFSLPDFYVVCRPHPGTSTRVPFSKLVPRDFLLSSSGHETVWQQFTPLEPYCNITSSLGHD